MRCIRLKPHPLSGLATIPPPRLLLTGLSHLLTSQRSPIDELSISKPSVMMSLDAIRWEGCSSVKKLSLSCFDHEEEDYMALLGRGMIGGNLQSLEEFNVIQQEPFMPILAPILSALERGACPAIKKLILCSFADQEESDDGGAIARALQSGLCRTLEELSLTNISMGTNIVKEHTAICVALANGHYPRLSSLQVGHLNRVGVEALARAVRENHLPQLNDLVCSWPYDDVDDHDSQSTTLICEALETHGKIRQLTLYGGVGRMVEGATSLARLLSSGACHQLESLHLGTFFRNHVGVLRVLTALQEPGAVPHLKSLSFSSLMTPVLEEHCGALGGVLRSGALIKLKELVMMCCRMSDEGVKRFLQGVESGGCKSLRRLKMRASKVTSKGGEALARVLAGGSLPHLRSLEISFNGGIIGDDMMAQVIKGLGLKCPELEQIEVDRKEMMGIKACEALVEGFEGKAWPQLQHLSLPGCCFDNIKLAERFVCALVEKRAGWNLRTLEIWRMRKSGGGGEEEEEKEMMRLADRLVEGFASGVCPFLRDLTVPTTIMAVKCRAAFASRGHSRLTITDFSQQERDDTTTTTTTI